MRGNDCFSEVVSKSKYQHLRSNDIVLVASYDMFSGKRVVSAFDRFASFEEVELSGQNVEFLIHVANATGCLKPFK